MIWRLFVILLLLTVVRWALVKAFGTGRRTVRTREQRGFGAASSKRMVKDPQCGMYLAPELALEMRRSEGSLYFCSKECQENYAKAQLKEIVE
ncbi:MAG: hypothetical protein EHM61_13525 [Acidobacteria bacterium]|nr:MAG: hypothetical protein EHM61_13525 [Acidobacteriota bacterium]